MSKKTNMNRYMFGLGTVGRDMQYTLISMFLMYYLTDILNLPDSTMWGMTGALLVLRSFDAINDPLMGLLVDNTHSRFGKFKPWIGLGGLIGGILTILIFTDFGLSGSKYVISFVILYLLWDLTYGANDIAYWSMLPSLSLNPREREKIGSFARICANVGLYLVVVAIIPFTNALGGDEKAWQTTSIIIVLIMLAFLLFTILGVKEESRINVQEDSTSLKEMMEALFKNDQLKWTALSMSLFTIGYVTTTGFGVYFFKYAYKDEDMYSVFALILGVSQLIALAIFPKLAEKYNRKELYSFATILVVVGYIIFFFSPMNIVFLGLAAILLFAGQAFIQLMMLMFLSDTVEYGQWKLGKRNESITFSVQPFINKIGGAMSNGIVGATLIISGINSAATPNDVTDSGLIIMKTSMMIVPLILILLGYIIYKKKYIIDKEMYDKIIADLTERGEIVEGGR
ncbi:MAG: MFS transporter [Clostridiales bacterium]|jgi:sugar (glycoside-pentoside-hexuronide) transporter|nr:MFS transporter [Clostridiales bacterium]